MELPDISSIKALKEYFETLPTQAGLFLGASFVLNRFIFTPFLDVIEERRKKTVLSFKNAERLVKESTVLLSQYEHKLKDYKEHIRGRVEQARQQIHQKQAGHLDETRETLLKNMNFQTKKNQESCQSAEIELNKDIISISEDLSHKFLGVDA